MRDDEIDRMVDETGEITAHGGGVVLVTGATGLLGAQVVRRWARLARPPRLAVLVRDPERWRTTLQRLGLPSCAAIALAGDVMCDGLGLSRAARAWLGGHATALVHLAADTTFSRPLEQAGAARDEHVVVAVAGRGVEVDATM